MEDIGNAADAFRHLSAANDAHKQAIGYAFEQDATIFDAIERAFSRPAAVPGNGPDDAPIFVVGMPRTGTTLVDRILSSHRDVEAAGELQAMPVAVKRLSGTASRTVIDPETVAAGAQADPAAIGAAYLAQAAYHRRTSRPRFTDKLPANFLYVGHIARSLPNARIVCLRRNPMDTIWSNYKNLFASQSAYYAYSYDLMDTAHYYARFDRLMALWESLWPGRVLQLSYEALVADQEGQTPVAAGPLRPGLGCGLPVVPREHRGGGDAERGARFAVRINADGMGRWKRHADALEPARAWLRGQGLVPG